MSVHSQINIIGQIAYIKLRHIALRVSSIAGYTVKRNTFQFHFNRGDD
jgi:hypothetical protein